MQYQAPPDLLKNRYIVVSGAGRGIGREAALTYARHGASLILLGRTEHSLNEVQQEIAAQGYLPAKIYPVDFSTLTAEQCQALAQWLTQQVPHLDGLLHNASILGPIVPTIELNPNAWQEVMQVNVTAALLLTQALLPLLLQAPYASMIFTSSGVVRKRYANWGAYTASKYATEGLVQVLAAEYQHSGLRVNCLNPGSTRTQMRHTAFPEEDPLTLVTPTDIMPLYLYLMGDDSLQHNGVSFDAQPKLY
ncbi:MAG: YciK family oxidoreductase [Enterobacteriaceae bacterium]